MKEKIIIVVLLVAAVVFSVLYFKATVLDVNPTILTVAGEGKVKVAPEIAQFTITYVSAATTSAEVIKAEKRLKEKIVNLLTDKYDVDTSQIQASYPQIAPAATTRGVVYQATNSLDVTFKKLSSLDAAVNEMYEMGGLSISNIIYTTQNPRTLEDEAINKAVTDAKMRAEKMSLASGKKLGKLVSIAGNQTQAVGTVTTEVKKQTNDPAASQSAEITPGSIEITRTVTLVYELR